MPITCARYLWYAISRAMRRVTAPVPQAMSTMVKVALEGCVAAAACPQSWACLLNRTACAAQAAPGAHLLHAGPGCRQAGRAGAAAQPVGQTRQADPPDRATQHAPGPLPASRGRRAGTHIPGSGLRSARGTGAAGQPGWPVPADTAERQGGRGLSAGATARHIGRGTTGLRGAHTRAIPLSAGWKRHKCLRWSEQYTHRPGAA